MTPGIPGKTLNTHKSIAETTRLLLQNSFETSRPGGNAAENGRAVPAYGIEWVHFEWGDEVWLQS